MLVKRLGIIGILATFLALLGCEKDAPDDRLTDIAAEQRNQEKKVTELARKVTGIEATLKEIRDSLRGIGRDSRSGAPAEERQSQPVDFGETPEYQKMAAALSAIQEQLNKTQTDAAQAREALDKEMERENERQNELAELKNELAGRIEENTRRSRQMFDSMKDPQSVNERVDALAQNFAQQIDDPARRQQLQDDLNYLKWLNSQSLSTQELHDVLSQHLNQRLANPQDEDTRKWIQRQIASLSSVSSEPEHQAAAQVVLDGVRLFENFDFLRQMKERYGIPEDALREAGLPANFPRFKALDGGGIQMQMQSQSTFERSSRGTDRSD